MGGSVLREDGQGIHTRRRLVAHPRPVPSPSCEGITGEPDSLYVASWPGYRVFFNLREILLSSSIAQFTITWVL